MCRSFSISGIEIQREKLFDIASAEIAIEEIPIGKREKVSIDWYIGFQRFVEPTLDHWIHEVTKSDPLISKERGSHEEFRGCRFPNREIEER
jgi:hypothetical protein